MVAVSLDGNRKMYRFNRKGADESPYFEGTFVSKDTEVEAFVARIRHQVKTVEWSGRNQKGAGPKSTNCQDQQGLQRVMEGLVLKIKQRKAELYRDIGSPNMSLQAYEGLKCLLVQKLQGLTKQMDEAFSTYRNVLTDPTALQEEIEDIEEMEEEEEEEDGEIPLSLDETDSDDAE
ncbi:unnamed protein product [Merluccius merluccius]